MNDQMIICANQFALLLGFSAGTFFWIFVVKSIFD